MYLNDHLAGSDVAIELLQHLEAEAADLAPELRRLRSDIEADRQQLKALLAELGILESRVRKVGSWIAEKLGELKLEADDESGGPLRRLERLEAVALGIEGKLALWSALAAASTLAPELKALDYAQLSERAIDQRKRVEVLRLQSARAALTPEN
jgi:hypothetical protein